MWRGWGRRAALGGRERETMVLRYLCYLWRYGAAGRRDEMCEEGFATAAHSVARSWLSKLM